MEVNAEFLCLSSFILFLCLEYGIVICKNDDASVVDTIFGGNLGPEWNETCYITGCPTTQTMPTTESKTSGLAVNGHHPNFFELLYGGFSSTINTAYKTATNTGEEMYSTLQNFTAELAEVVREVLNEEFYHLVVNGFSNVIDAATAPGTRLFSLGITTLSISLFLLCLLLNYIFMFLFSFISIITFDFIVMFLHYHLGPTLIFDYIISFCSYFGQILFLLWKYPYYFGLIVTILSCVSCLMPIIRLTHKRNHRIQIETLADNIVHLNLTINNIRTQLTEIESKIDYILSTMEENS